MRYWSKVPPAHESLAAIVGAFTAKKGAPSAPSSADEMRAFVEQFNASRAG